MTAPRQAGVPELPGDLDRALRDIVGYALESAEGSSRHTIEVAEEKLRAALIAQPLPVQRETIEGHKRLQRTISRLQKQVTDLKASRDYWQARGKPTTAQPKAQPASDIPRSSLYFLDPTISTTLEFDNEPATMTPEQVRDGIADWIETNIKHKEFWTPEVVSLIKSIEIRPEVYARVHGAKS